MEARLVKLCVDRKAAAEMVDLSPGAFDSAVEAGFMPPAIKIGRRKMWAVKALEKAVDRLAGIGPESDAEAMEALWKWKKSRDTSSDGR